MGGALEIVNESCGLLVPFGNTSELSKALEQLIGDNTLRSALGGNGPSRASELCDPTSRLRDLRDALASVAYVEAIT
jgi:glycosyltransferase involved in cell wall biosynthesis